ncbi:UDP-glycosyltransferase 82A1 [Acorus calamus]|uniref:Glycosyltransferase n=1 Tax=Acorus calamus TaxID=4465 RepID=A0AAV9DP04_ACOCL|nr:UDP-glycosyltransferase 82A1 [Acorus calamus]
MVEGRPRIVFVPYPAQGHITPMFHLAHAMHHQHGFESILVNPNFIHNRLIASSSGATEDNHGVIYANIPDGLHDGESIDFFAISHAMENHMPCHLERLLKSFETVGGVSCVIVDLLASWAVGVAERCRIPVAGFWPAMLGTYRLISGVPDMIYRGLIDKNGTPLQEDATNFIKGQPKLNPEELPWLIGSPSSKRSRFAFWLRTIDRCKSLRWLILNTFHGEETNTENSLSSPRIFCVGPLPTHSPTPTLWSEDGICIEWLDKQSPSSVVYVSFGSWVDPIGDDKVAELALGLEASGKPFLWVLSTAWRSGLPKGYLDRVKGRGILVSWAPQREVLGHDAVGCYLMHCGWNSTIEAVERGKRLLCYPVAGDQFVNCAYIVDVWKVGVRLGKLERREVEEGVKRLMDGCCGDGEGGKMMRRVMVLKEQMMGRCGRLGADAELNAFVDALANWTLDECVKLSCFSSL